MIQQVGKTSKMKDIKGYEGLYSVTSQGQVWSYPKKKHHTEGKFLLPDISNTGYHRVTLVRDGVKTRWLVHRLILWVHTDELGEQCNHKDMNKSNNTLDNLEWCDASYNQQHAGEHSKDKEEVQLFTKLFNEGVSMREIGRRYGTNHRYVSRRISK